MRSVILVTGSLGRIGGAVIYNLVQRDVNVRALVHFGSGNEWENWANVTPVTADFAHPVTLDAALAGIQSVFLVSSRSANQVDLQNAFIDACVRNGVRHIIKMSELGADPAATCRFFRWHAATEEHLRNSGVHATTVRANMFFPTFVERYANAMEGAPLITSRDPDTRVSMVDPRDLAAVIAALLLDPHAGDAQEVVEVTGGWTYSQREMAAALSEHLGRPIGYQAVSRAAYGEALRDARIPAQIAAGLVELDEWYDSGAAARVNDTIKRTTGMAPRTLAAYLLTIKATLLRT